MLFKILNSSDKGTPLINGDEVDEQCGMVSTFVYVMDRIILHDYHRS